jgi:hypothetical protein
MISEYKIRSQESLVKGLQEKFDELTKKIDDEFPKEDPVKLEQLLVIRNVLITQEEKLEKMKSE